MDSITVSGVTCIYIHIYGLRYTFFSQKRETGSSVAINALASCAAYEVNTVDLKTREVGEASDILHATVLPAVAASSNRIIVCGGFCHQRVFNYCQVYSPQTNE